eukprot:3933929-Rhodomonas_salina.2
MQSHTIPGSGGDLVFCLRHKLIQRWTATYTEGGGRKKREGGREREHARSVPQSVAVQQRRVSSRHRSTTGTVV